ncbi:AraC family transcriptional regulator [Actinorugispora endophytica]|uniref:AraC family transcriptional regulator n=1 Tax=Actinorugispora endophytica TaxID=1605990 RepID=UPI001AAD4D48|nr:AraC family transcriptional regulator [Actinorugispora endophytica]
MAELLMGRTATREVVPHDPRHSVRWHVHDYPSPYARWNYHPELEVHLIRSGSGRYIVGDAVGPFGAGQLVLVGPNVPHGWISDLEPGEVITGRDMVLQFDADWVRACQQVLPELDSLDPLLAESGRGIEFSGRSAAEAARELELVGASEGIERVLHVLGLLNILSTAPASERRALAREWFAPNQDPRLGVVMERAMAYVVGNLTGEVRMSELAASVDMSESSFSKYFKRASGMTFTDMVRRLRLSHACRLLERGGDTVAAISHAVGYSNLSNFNRQFRREYGMTPTRFRAETTRAASPRPNGHAPARNGTEGRP